MQLVRDLIIVIENFNRNCVKRKMPLRLIAGIRTVVLSAVETIGQEINKIISDFGRPLNWQYAGNDYQNHPLMKLLTKRIMAS